MPSTVRAIFRLRDLDDLAPLTLTDGYFLKYNSTTGKFELAAVPAPDLSPYALITSLNSEASTRASADTSLSSSLATHVANVSNPHVVTVTQIGAVDAVATRTANTVYAGPSSGSAAAGAFRALVAADIPSLSAVYVPIAQVTGGGVLATGGFTLTVPATGTAALLGAANVFTAAQVVSVAGALSVPPVLLSGAWLLSGGTGTTTKPQLLVEPAATTSNAWSTSGTGLGVNAPNGFAGNLIDLQVNGGSSKFRVNNIGGVIAASNVSIGAGSNYGWSGRSQVQSSADGNVLVMNSGGNGFTLLQFGGTTSSFPALKRSTTVLEVKLADDSAYADLAIAKLRTNQSSSATILGLVTKKLPIYNESGTLLGYVPIYDAIT